MELVVVGVEQLKLQMFEQFRKALEVQILLLELGLGLVQQQQVQLEQHQQAQKLHLQELQQLK